MRRPLVKLIALALLCLLPGLGLYRLASQGSYWPIFFYSVASICAFGLYCHDKRCAQRNAWRTPELRLHMVELLGGWSGALIAQQVFKHKTRKASFQVVFWLIVLTHQLLWMDYLHLDCIYPMFSFQ